VQDGIRCQFKTPGGNSLNGVLAKGQNRLRKLQHLLVRFRRGRAAVTADISMAYNGTKLRPEHLKYQKYLWKDDLLPENPTKVMYVTTLIYMSLGDMLTPGVS
jgi:hypothetical protein